MRMFHIAVNATRECYLNGTWALTTDYNDCLCNSTQDCSEDLLEDGHNDLDISIIIYLVGKFINLDIFNEIISVQVM